MGEEPGAVTRLLQAWRNGDLQAREALIPLVYQDLKRQAGAYLRHERRDHTLQPTALVHEAFVRLVGQNRVDWQSRAHFYGVAAQMMRRILVDHARARRAEKRPEAGVRMELDDRIGAAPGADEDLVLLDQALTELSTADPRQGQIVELRYFAGMSEQEVADLLSLSRTTVTREWRQARGWLYHRMRGPARVPP